MLRGLINYLFLTEGRRKDRLKGAPAKLSLGQLKNFKGPI
jgi:hypothetical protein